MGSPGPSGSGGLPQGTPRPVLVTALVVVVVSGSLVLGAALGVSGRLSGPVEGFLVALAGGALLVSAVVELIEPAIEQAPVWSVLLAVLLGATVFSVLDHLVDERWGPDQGGGLLAAITLDGIPENLALGVALISTGPVGVAALSGSILLSNLPEAAGGARAMSGAGRSVRAVLGLWAATALLLSLAALAGYLLLGGAPAEVLGLLQAFAAGAVVASLATEVFPKAFQEESYTAGAATAVGVVLAVGLNQLGG